MPIGACYAHYRGAAVQAAKGCSLRRDAWFCWKQDEDRGVAFARAVQMCKFRRSRSFGILSSCTGFMNDRSELPCLMYLSLTSAGSELLGHGCCPGIGGLE